MKVRFIHSLLLLSLMVFLVQCSETNKGQISTYYINSAIGDNANAGTSAESPWENLDKLKGKTFRPGDSILFARNSNYVGGVLINSSGNAEQLITIGAYGEGLLPVFSNPDGEYLNGNVFRVSGSYIRIEDLSFAHCANSKSSVDTAILSVGAVYTLTGADYVTIRNCEFIDCPIGIYLNGQHSVIAHNDFRDCNRFLSEPDWGPLGIVIGNAYNEIAYNECRNYVKVGGNYGADGGFIELDDRYFGNKVHDVKIHHNKSFDNMGFLEVEGQVEGKNIDVYYNLSNDYQEFIFFWGGDSSRIENNTVIRTKPSLNGAVNTVFTMRNGNFTLRNNIFVVANDIQVLKTAPYNVGNYHKVVHENNLYYCIDGSTSNPCGKPLGADELIADPQFIDLDNGNYRLNVNSPAIQAGLLLGYSLDIDGNTLDNDQVPNLGAF